MTRSAGARRYCRHIEESHFQPAPCSDAPVNTSIQILPEEREIFALILETIRHFELKTVPRVAGGWVRDKLLRLESHDVDIALDDCSGEEFAVKINAYSELKGLATSSIGVIQANPDQSKHLETATMKLQGRDVDFVNLRSETYETDSRIPTITIGTPTQDAERRDFTVNSMFYNLLTREIEDLTGRGLADLALQRLRTPLPAGITFSDDPLRMLRGIRFASRLGFALDSEICDALLSPVNHVALAKKVSRERVGIELTGALRSLRPALALELLVSHRLAGSALNLPSPLVVNGAIVRRQAHGYWSTSVRVAAALQRNLGEARFRLASETEREIWFLSAALIHLRGVSFVNKKQKLEPATRFVILESLKLSKSTGEAVETIHKAASFFLSALQSPERSSAAFRLSVGRACFEAQDWWAHGLELALAELHASRLYSKNETEFLEASQSVADRLVEEIRAHKFVGLKQLLKRDPILDGHSVMKLLGIAGDETKFALDFVKDFVFLHPHETTETYKKQCEAFVLESWARRKRVKDEIQARVSVESPPAESPEFWSECERFRFASATETELLVYKPERELRSAPHAGIQSVVKDPVQALKRSLPFGRETVLYEYALPPSSVLVAAEPEPTGSAYLLRAPKGMRLVQAIRGEDALRALADRVVTNKKSPLRKEFGLAA